MCCQRLRPPVYTLCPSQIARRYADEAPFVEFRNPETGRHELLCQEVFETYAMIQVCLTGTK